MLKTIKAWLKLRKLELSSKYVVKAFWVVKHNRKGGAIRHCKTHYAKDMADALEWAACYDYADTILIEELCFGTPSGYVAAGRNI